MFVGQLKSTLKCTKCDYKSPTFELFWHLAVPIPKQVLFVYFLYLNYQLKKFKTKQPYLIRQQHL